MGKRGVVTDYAGEELYAGDLVTYAVRHGNRVRMTDAVVEDVTTKNIGGRLLPTLVVTPTGAVSGWGLGARKTVQRVEISAEHVRLVVPDFLASLPTE
jgi:hypothetical protein